MPARPESLAFAILGRPLRATGVEEELARWLRSTWDYPEQVQPPHAYAIEVLGRQSAPDHPAPEWAEHEAALADRTLAFRNAGAAWEAHDEGAGVRLDLGNDCGRITVWGVDRRGPSGDFYHALYTVVSEALRSSGLLPLHAAVAARGERATAWLGSSGSGKSTTLLHASRAGWRPIAEDLCWVDPDDLGVYGWDRAVRAWPETLQRFFPDLADAPPASDGKLLVPYERLGACGIRSGTLTEITLLRREPAGASRAEPLPVREAVRALWEATGIALSPMAREKAAAAIAGLTRRCVTSRAVLGANGAPPIGGAGSG